MGYVCEHVCACRLVHLCTHTWICFHFLLAGDKLGALPREWRSLQRAPVCLPDLQLEPGTKSWLSLRLALGQSARGCEASGLLFPFPFLPCFPLRHGSSGKPSQIPDTCCLCASCLLLAFACHSGPEHPEGGLRLLFSRVGLGHCEWASSTIFTPFDIAVFVLCCGSRVVGSEKRPGPSVIPARLPACLSARGFSSKPQN